MTLEQWLLVIAIIFPVLVGLIIYAVKKKIEEIADNKIAPIHDAVQRIEITLTKNNGGSSIKDALDGLKTDVSELSGKFDQHIVEHGNTPAPRKLHSQNRGENNA